MADRIIYLGMDPSALPHRDRKLIEEIGLKSGYRVVVSDDQAKFEEVFNHVVIAAGSVPRERLGEAPSLIWFQQFGTGGNWLIPLEELRKSAVTITNMSDNHYNSLAEHVMALILGIFRQIHLSARAQTERRWHRPAGSSLVELSDLNLLLLGVGSIGKRIAELAAVFGMGIVGLRRESKQSDARLDRCVSAAQLLDVLPDADIVASTLPLTPETRHMVDDAAFRAMKRTAIFVNVGRGGTVDEEALILALQSGEIAAAGLDVFETEPLPQDPPLWSMENVLITGHYAGSSYSMNRRRIEVFTDNLRRFLIGEPLRNVVDKKHCY